jgi:tetratricopeptide (TPR) repeat protein
MMLILAAAAMFLQPSPAMLRQLFEQELVRCRAEHGESDRLTAQAARDVALFLVRQGATADARGALAEAIRLDEEALGPSHPLTLADVAELAAVSPREQAERLWMRAGRSSDALVAARALAALGQFRENAGDRAAAARFYRNSLAKEEAASRRDSPRVAVRLNTLARVVEAEEAIALLERALFINRSKLGPRHHETATIASNLANLLLGAGKWEEAARLSASALSVFEEAFGRESPRVEVPALILAQALRANGKIGAANEVERRYLSGR